MYKKKKKINTNLTFSKTGSLVFGTPHTYIEQRQNVRTIDLNNKTCDQKKNRINIVNFFRI